MSTITMGTRQLLQLLATLVHTSAEEPEAANGGVLLHCDRGHGYGPHSGLTDILVGTSTTGWVVGHTFAPTGGQLHRPALWAIDDVKAVIAAFKPKLKGDKQAEVSITLSGSEVVVAEAGQLDIGGDGLKITFTEKSLTDYPRDLWRALGDVLVNPVVTDRTGHELPTAPRTDFSASSLEPFVKVAKLRGATIETYRFHQHSRVQVQIGDSYRGLLIPTRWDGDDTRGAGDAPDADVYPPTMPTRPNPHAVDLDTPPAGGNFRTGTGVIIGAAPTATDTPLTGFPQVEPDTELLCRAAEIVITTQFGSVSVLGRKLHIGHTRAASLLEQLHDRGVVGPKRGSQARDVLVTADLLDTVLSTIRDITAPADAAEEPDDADA